VLGARLKREHELARLTTADALAEARPDVVVDLERLPFAVGQFDLVVSGLALQVVNDLPGVLAQVCGCLKPDGLFLGAMTGGRTLEELRAAFLQAETEVTGGVSPRVAPMVEVRDFGSLLQRAGFALPVVDSDVVEVTYAHPLALMRELRAMGAGNVLAERRRNFLRRDVLARAIEIYQQRFAVPGGRVRATFEILTATAWAPHASQQKPLKPGSAQVRLGDVLGKGSAA
jgi:SAM-dependent methyltransferase